MVISPKKATNSSGLFSPSATRKGRVMTGIQLPILASEDPKEHPYLWNHWCCNCLGHRLTHRWAVGSGHHRVLLAALRACGGLSGFEEKKLVRGDGNGAWWIHWPRCGRRQAAPQPAHTPAAPTPRAPQVPPPTITGSSLALCMHSPKEEQRNNYFCTRPRKYCPDKEE